MRTAGVNAKHMVRAAGVPALLYGVEVMGLANTALQTTRSRVAAAAAPQAGGKNPDLTLYALDGSSGTLDPAFECHLMPLKHWALAWWEGWFTPRTLEVSFRSAELKMAAPGSSWRKVTGPTAATIASMTRLGWVFSSAREIVDDLGASWSFRHDSPAAIAQACKRSVKRWRLARVIKALPTLQPQGCDFGASSAVESTVLVDFAGSLHSLLHGKSAGVASVPQWCSSLKGDLASAISGGQWPQTRRASVPSWQVTDLRCQLCLSAPGTLEHRHNCAKTVPVDGWPPDPPKADLALRRVGQARAETLRTRGLLVMRLPSPQGSADGWFKWLSAPGPECDELFTWYLDGSMQDGTWIDYRAVGFGVVVVAPDRSLAAYGFGVPPSWCKTAAASEAWALHIALLQSAFPPKLRTDCQCLLTTARGGAVQATGSDRPLARIWNIIANSLDGQIEQIVQRGNLVWMPAHQPLSAIGNAMLSNGKLLSGVDWRANRLVDALAKAAAETMRAPRALRCLLESGRAAVKHRAALLAVVTHAANNHKELAQRPDGSWGTQTRRDAQQPDGHVRKQRRLLKPPVEPAAPPVVELDAIPSPRPSAEGSSLEPSVGTPAEDQLGDLLGDQLEDLLEDQLGDQLRDQLGDQLGNQLERAHGRLTGCSRKRKRPESLECRRKKLAISSPAGRPTARPGCSRRGAAKRCRLEETSPGVDGPRYRVLLTGRPLIVPWPLAATSSDEQRRKAAGSVPDPADELRLLHQSGLKVEWPRSEPTVATKPSSSSGCGAAEPPSGSCGGCEAAAAGYHVSHKLPSSSNCGVVSGSDTPFSTAPGRAFDKPSVAQDGLLAAALEDLELLHKCGIPVIWPRSREAR